MKILLQVPEGLKTEALKIADQIGDEVVISCEPCYGACDVRVDEARRLGCSKIIHYEHSKLIETDIPVEYIVREKQVKISEVGLEKLDCQTVGLVTTVQHLASLNNVKKMLEGKGKKVFIGGQILGCDLSNAKSIEDKVECFLFVGSGRFHALGLSLSTDKPVFVLDFEKNIIEKIDNTVFLRQKIAAQELAKDSRTVGILISTKLGQCRPKAAEEMKIFLKHRGIKSYILSMDEIRQEKLEGLKLDAYINTACPRIAIENRTEFKKPIINIEEAREIFK